MLVIAYFLPTIAAFVWAYVTNLPRFRYVLCATGVLTAATAALALVIRQSAETFCDNSFLECIIALISIASLIGPIFVILATILMVWIPVTILVGATLEISAHTARRPQSGTETLLQT